MLRPTPLKAAVMASSTADENANVVQLSPFRSKKGLQSSDVLRNIIPGTSKPDGDSKWHKPAERKGIRFQEKNEFFSPEAQIATSSLSMLTPFEACPPTGGPNDNRKVMAGRTPHQFVSTERDSSTPQSNPLFNYDYAYHSTAKPVVAEQVQAQLQSPLSSLHGMRLSPSPLPQRSRPPSDQFTVGSSLPSPMKQQSATSHQNSAPLHSVIDRTMTSRTQFESRNQSNFESEQHNNLIFGDCTSPPSSCPEGSVPELAASRQSPRALIENSSNHIHPSNHSSVVARSVSAPSVSLQTSRGITNNDKEAIGDWNSYFGQSQDDSIIHASPAHRQTLGSNQKQQLQEEAAPTQRPVAGHLSIPNTRGLDTRAPVGMYRRENGKTAPHGSSMTHFDEYQRLIMASAASARDKTNDAAKQGPEMGVSLRRPGLGSRRNDNTSSGPPEAARSLVGQSPCPRPIWSDASKSAAVQQDKESSATTLMGSLSAAQSAMGAKVARSIESTRACVLPVASPGDVADVASLGRTARHSHNAQTISEQVNFDVSMDSSSDGSNHRAPISEARGIKRNGMTAMLKADESDELDKVGLDQLISSLSRRQDNDTKRHVHAITGERIPSQTVCPPTSRLVIKRPIPVLAKPSTNRTSLGIPRRVKTSELDVSMDSELSIVHGLSDFSSTLGNPNSNIDGGITSNTIGAKHPSFGVGWSPSKRTGFDLLDSSRRSRPTTPRHHDTEEESDFSLSPSPEKSTGFRERQSIVSFSIDAGQVDQSGRDSAELDIDASYNDSFANCADVDISTYSTVATTLSMDNSFANDSFAQADATPRLAVGPRRHKSSSAAADDMKEITLRCGPGEFNTIVLTFSNKKSRRLVLRPRAILVRFDKSGTSASSAECGDESTMSVGPTGNIFQVSPSLLNLHTGESSSLYVTFSPSADHEGIYGGALKIKAKGKSFVLLLRGEARRPSIGRVDQSSQPLSTIEESYRDAPVETSILEKEFQTKQVAKESTFPEDAQSKTSISQPSTPAQSHDALSSQSNAQTILRARWLKSWLNKERVLCQHRDISTNAPSIVACTPRMTPSNDPLTIYPSTLILACVDGTESPSSGALYQGEVVIRNNRSASQSLTMSASENCLSLSVSRVELDAFGDIR